MLLVVSENTINKAVAKMAQKEGRQEIMQSFGKKQPFLYSYAMAMGDMSGIKEYADFLFNSTAIICYSFSQETSKVIPVTEKIIEKIESRQYDDIQKFIKEADEKIKKKALKKVVNSNQSNLVKFISDEIVSNIILSDDQKEMLFTQLKVIIEAMDEVVNAKNPSKEKD
jgi:hypothetical protein